VSFAYNGSGTVTASVANTKTDLEYALLAGNATNPVVGAPAIPGAEAPAGTAWSSGTGSNLDFAGLSADTYYYLVSRPHGYTEVTYAQAALNTDGSLAAYRFKTPATAAVDVKSSDISRLPNGFIAVQMRPGYTYRLINPATGEYASIPLMGVDGSRTFLGLDAETTYQVVSMLDTDGVWMRGVRVYPSTTAVGIPELKINYEHESVSLTGTEDGVVPTNLVYSISTGTSPVKWLAGDGADNWVAGTGTAGIDLGAPASGETTSILDTIQGTEATLTYRLAAPADGYTGDTFFPTLTLTIPARPAAPTAGLAAGDGYHFDYPGEALVAGTAGALQFAPRNSTAWTLLATSSTTAFTTLGWSGNAYDFDARYRFTSSAFASKTAQDSIALRPAAPELVASSGAGNLTVGTFANGVVYEFRQGNDPWGSFTGDGGTQTWPYNPEAPGADYEVRLQATASTAASYVATVSAPIIIDPVNFPATPYQGAISGVQVSIGNISSAPITLDSLALVGGDAARFTLSSGSLEVPLSGNTSYTVSPIIPAGGLDVGTYQTKLVATYTVGVTQKTTVVNVTLSVTKIDWDVSSLQLSVSGVTTNALTLNVSGAPDTSKIVFRAGSTAWSAPVAVSASGLASTSFTGLTPASTYVLAVRVEGDNNHYESALKQINGYTQYAAPTSFDQVLSVDYQNEVLKFNSGFNAADYEVKIDGTVIANPSLYSLTTYANGANFTISVAHKAGPAATPYPASAAVTKTVTARLAAPTAGSITTTKATTTVANNGAIALSGAFEYRAHRDASQAGGWAGATASTSVSYGSYDVRRPATATVFASATTTVSVDVMSVYTVTYSAGTGSGTAPAQTGGNAGDGQSFYELSSVSVLAPGSISKTGSVFTGWTVSPAVTFDGTANTTFIPVAKADGTKTFIASANTTLTAQWEARPTVVSVTPTGSSANAALSGTLTIVFSEDMSATPGTLTLVGTGTPVVSGGSWTNATTYNAAYSSLAYSSSYTYTISGFTRTSGTAMETNSGTLGFSTMADPARTVTSVAQFGGTNGKVTSSGILVTFDHAVTAPPASAFVVSVTGSGSTTTVTKGTVSNGGDSDDATWVINVTGDWVNGADDVSVAVVSNWGGYSVASLSLAHAVSDMFAVTELPFTPPAINYADETLVGLAPERTYNYKYTDASATVISASFTTGAGETAHAIDAAWMNGIANDFQIQRVAVAAEPYVDSAWKTITIPARRPASAVTDAGVTPSSQLISNTIVGKISGLTTGMQYKNSTGVWKTFAGSGTYPDPTTITEGAGSISPLTPGTYYVRLNYTVSNFVSEAHYFTIHDYGSIGFDEVDQGYSSITPLNVEDTINAFFSSPADNVTVTAVTLNEGSNSNFVVAGTGSGITLRPVVGLAPGIYSEAITISRIGGSGADGSMSPTAQVRVNGVAAFAAVDGLLVNGGATAASSTLTLKFRYPVLNLDASSFAISGGAKQSATPNVTSSDGGLTYVIAIEPTSTSTRDQETINVSVTLPVVAGVGGLSDIYAYQKTTLGATISATTNVRVPRGVDESKTLTHNLPGYATTYIQFTIKGAPYYPAPDLESMSSEVSVVGNGANSTPGAASVERVVRVDASKVGDYYYTYRVYLTNVSGGDVSLHFNTFTSLNTSDYVMLNSGTTPGSRAYFLETSSSDSARFQNILTDLERGAQLLPDVVGASGTLDAPEVSFLTGVDLTSGKSVAKVLLNGVELDASKWATTAAATLDYSFDGGPWITPASPMLLTLKSGFTNLSGAYALEVILSDDSYLYGEFAVTGIPTTYAVGLSQGGTYDFTSQQRGYASLSPRAVSVTNTGNQSTGVLAVALAGGSSSNFTISATILASIANRGSASNIFSVVPKDGLVRGTYTDTVSVTGANGISATFGVRFEVQNSAPAVASGQATHSGTAVPASSGNINAASPYTTNVASWFTDTDGDTLSYAVVSSGFAGLLTLAATTGALEFVPVAADSGKTDTIVVRANDGTENSASNAVITVAVGAVAPYITTQPVSTNYWTDTPAASVAALGVATSGEVGTLTYQWYSNTSASNIGGSPISGATASTYVPNVSAPGTAYYYVVVTATPTTNSGPAASVRSGVATIVATARPANAVAPTFASSPVSRTDYKTTGETADTLTFALNPNGNGTLTYQWYSNTSPSNVGGTPLTGATNPSYTPDISVAGTQYYFVEVIAYVLNAATPLDTQRSATATITSANRQYVVQFDIGNTSAYRLDLSGEDPDPVQGDINTNVVLPTSTGNVGKLDFARVNFSFAGWDTIEGGLENAIAGNTHYAVGAPYTSASDTAPVTLYAAWVENFAVIFDSAGGTSVPGVHVLTPSTYGALVSGGLPTPTRPGYDFDGWYLEVVDDLPFTSTLVADADPVEASATQSIRLVAHWSEQADVNIDFVASPMSGGSITPGGSEQVAPATGTLAAREASAYTGYTFTNWTDGSGTLVSSVPTLVPAKVGGVWVADTYTANFQAKSITVNFVSADGVSVATTVVPFDSAYGTLPTLTRAGWTFVGWFTASTGGTQVTEVSILNDDTSIQTLYAQWSENIYPVLEHFGTYAGTGTISARIDFGDPSQFVRLIYTGTNSVVDSQHFAVTIGSTIVTLTEQHAQTYPAGTHYFVAEFSDGRSDLIRLDIKEADTTPTPTSTTPEDGPTAPTGGGLPSTGDLVAVCWWLVVAMLGTAAIGLFSLRYRLVAGSRRSGL
jgi:uncharacterized repeat protein (TIGR02543 family)